MTLLNSDSGSASHPDLGGGLGDFPVNGDGRFRTDHCTYGAAGAALADYMGGVVTFGGQAFHVQRQYMLGALQNTQLAALTVNLTHINGSLEGHSYLLM
jgi:hypothetical protein